MCACGCGPAGTESGVIGTWAERSCFLQAHRRFLESVWICVETSFFISPSCFSGNIKNKHTQLCHRLPLRFSSRHLALETSRTRAPETQTNSHCPSSPISLWASPRQSRRGRRPPPGAPRTKGPGDLSSTLARASPCHRLLPGPGRGGLCSHIFHPCS